MRRGLVVLWLLLLGVQVGAQPPLWCEGNQVTDIAWSPDGETLAVLSLHGVSFYDADLLSLGDYLAPLHSYSYTSLTGLVWSPDSQWVVLPNHAEVDAPSTWSIANAITGEIRSILNPFEMTDRSTIVDIVWSPDNDLLLALKYEPQIGLMEPYSELIVLVGALDGGFSPYWQRMNDVRIENLTWDTEMGITGNIGGLQVRFDPATLTLSPDPPTLRERWWVVAPDGSREAGFLRTLEFYVRDTTLDAEQQIVLFSPLVDAVGEFVVPGYVSDFVWTVDSERIVAVYVPVTFINRDIDPQPEDRQVVQGAIIDAVNAIEQSHFFWIADAPVESVSISARGDRLAVWLEDGTISVWNPETEALVGEITVRDLGACG